MINRLIYLIRLSAVFFVLLVVMSQSTVLELERSERVRAYTRLVEFDYVSWTLNAFKVKWEQNTLSTAVFLTQQQQHDLVYECRDLVTHLNQLDAVIENIYADPAIKNPAETSASFKSQRDQLLAQQALKQPVCESILQQQVSAVLKDEGLTLGGQPIPALLYHVTPLPMALITSPRGEIKQEQNLSLNADLKIEDITHLEEQVEKNLNVSALVVPIGGVGVYPTMVLSSDNLAWQIDTISHEWTHNYLTLRPLGLNYETTPELRTMNETTASIVGGEVGKEVLRRYYPELLPPPEPEVKVQAPKPEEKQVEQAPVFNFNKEMHETRVHTDLLLKAGKIEEAEKYMESRRQFLWDNGYHLRRINQAYFAFYGAYADTPGGAAGNDPVGPAVVKLREQSPTLADFLNRISWMNSFDNLKQAIAPAPQG